MPVAKKQLVQDFFFILLSIALAIFFAKMGLVERLIDSLDGFRYLAIFVSGMLFTSVFTTPFAIVALGELAVHNNIWLVALLGGFGAVSGDYLIFRFVRDRVSEDFGYLLSISKVKRLPHLFRTHAFRWFAPFIGALIIASPLPDEIGVAILGFSKLDERVFLPLSYTANSVGILMIGLLATKFFG